MRARPGAGLCVTRMSARPLGVLRTLKASTDPRARLEDRRERPEEDDRREEGREGRPQRPQAELAADP